MYPMTARQRRAVFFVFDMCRYFQVVRQGGERPAIVAVLLIVAFGCVAYLPSFDVPFTFDDVPNIVNNPAVHAESLGDLWSADDRRIGRNLRPLAMTTFAANHLVSGLDPFSYHAVNLAIHITNGILLYLLLMQLFAAIPPRPAVRSARPIEPGALALFAALFWVLNPANTQAVTYIVQRMTSLSTMFYLAAMLTFVLLRRERIGVWWGASLIILCFAGGMATKELIVTLPAALWLIDVVVLGRFTRLHRYALAAIAMFGVAMIAIYASSDLSGFWTQLPRRDFSGYERVLTQGGVLWHYIGLYLLPLPDRMQLDYEWPISQGMFEPVSTFVAWSGWIALAALAWRLRKAWPWPALALLFYLVACSVESSFVNLEMVFEHRVYLPSIFIAPALLSLISVSTRPRATMIVLWLLIALIALGTIERNRQWGEFEGFWVEELERGASPVRAATNAAFRYNRLGQPAKALELVENVERHYEIDNKLEQQRATALMGLGRYQEAEASLLRILASAPHWLRARYFHGQILLNTGRLHEAEEVAEAIVEQAPASIYGVSLQALILQHRGAEEQGIERIHRYLERYPGLSAVDRNVVKSHLANLQLALDYPQAALETYREIVATDPENFHAWAQIYRLLRAGGDDEQAARVKRLLDRWGVRPSAWEGDRAPRGE